MITVISGNQGWITVAPDNLSRKKPIEKQFQASDNTKTSVLTPSWMKIDAPNRVQGDTMKGRVEKFGLREESNRTFLTDKQQPGKSIFSIGSVRHNVHSKAMASTFNNAVSQ